MAHIFTRSLIRCLGRTQFSTRALFCAALALTSHAHAQTRPLNDSGQTNCYNGANAAVSCSAAVGGDSGVNPRQDGRYGRDPAAAAAQLTKIGAGDAGFDYTKIANNGTALPASATLGSAATDWACTRDNVTGLIWEVKTTSGLRSQSHTYTWRSTDATTNGGDAGDFGTDTCGGTLAGAPYENQCNTQNFAAAVNAATLCGQSDWRVPSKAELLSIVHAGKTNPAVDNAYFPNTPGEPFFWTRSTSPGNAANASTVWFYGGASEVSAKANATRVVRLVRGGL